MLVRWPAALLLLAGLAMVAGADVNLPDGVGVTPLAHARQRGQEQIAGILRDAGARS